MSFGRLERREAAPPMSDINMTPLIDVMLVLLVIFMVAAPLMTAALQLDLPKAMAAQPLPSSAAEPARVSLDARGQAFWNDQAVDAATLQARLTALAQADPEAEIQLAIDQTVPYGRVATLLDQLQSLKLTRLAFVTAAPASAPR
ncbi:ExbD/TolR family protein [Inhella gelatinilytica]|uniref:Biopolymer transporter ExbD n=1 Tax=Inhella gelatinilytica TaxID=2795030 RepID=A0A931N9U2_9BURK|nr:biopolymer transporter ExbD [Inhella gelatinilytica]MBH9551733.1 biopolymer transporter ExbD [Inhella gelatinilytica]